MTSSRTVIVAGAGIGGLTVALALARNGFRVIVLEQAERLDETGAGIQLSPNATRMLIDLGLGDRLRPHVVAPQAVRVLNAKNGREIVRIPLGDAADAALRRAVLDHPSRRSAGRAQRRRGGRSSTSRSSSACAWRISPPIRNGVTVSARGGTGAWNEHGHALIAADGLWSISRARFGFSEPPRFAGRTAWRALVPATDVRRNFANR